MAAPPRIRPGLAPGGLYATVIVEGLVVDGWALDLDDPDTITAVAERHGNRVADGRADGAAIYDGDTGDLVAVLYPGGADIVAHQETKQCPE
jgi:hypothetical protein